MWLVLDMTLPNYEYRRHWTICQECHMALDRLITKRGRRKLPGS